MRVNFLRRYRRLTLWNRLGAWGSVASIVSLVSWIAIELVDRSAPHDVVSRPTPAVSETTRHDRPTQPSYPETFLLVDNSGSMRLTPVVEKLWPQLMRSDGARVGMGTFGERFQLLLRPGRYPLRVLNDALLHVRASNGRCTDVCGGMVSAAAALRSVRAAPTEVVVLTDNVDELCPWKSGEPDSCEFERLFPGSKLRLILFGAPAEAREAERLFPQATVEFVPATSKVSRAISPRQPNSR